MTSATIFEAKTHLSGLIKKASEGETVVITSGRDKKPVAKIMPIESFKPRRLGVCQNPNFVLPPDFFDPPTDEELKEWESGL